MNTNTAIGILVAVIILLGGGYFLYSSMGSGTEETTESENTGDQAMTGGDTFAAILAAGADVQCEFTNQISETETASGRTYIANRGELVRADLTASNMPGEESHMVRKDNFTYLWGSQMPQGIKIALAEGDKGNFVSQPGTSAPDTARFTCEPWIVDPSLFEIPTDIEFTDMSAMVPQANDTSSTGAPQGTGAASGGDLKAMQCAACNQAPDAESRAQCLQALSCPL